MLVLRFPAQKISMQKFISFLRGVNMTGHNSMKMADLTSLCTDLGFRDVKTYIQSGNLIFSSDETEEKVRARLEKGITDKFSYNISAMIRTPDEIVALSLTNPYLAEDNFDAAKMAVIFLHEAVGSEQKGKVNSVSYPPDKFHIDGREIYIYCPNGFGRTKLYTNFFENRMGVTGTARNWKTITTIHNIASGVSPV